MWRFRTTRVQVIWSRAYSSDAKIPATSLATQNVENRPAPAIGMTLGAVPTAIPRNPTATPTKPLVVKETVAKTAKPDIKANPKVCSFGDIPGPISLQLISKFWSHVPVISSTFTAGALFQVMNLGKFFGNILSWGGNAKFFQKFFNVYGPVVRLHGPFGGDVVLLSRPEHASLVFRHEGDQPVRSCLDSVEKYRLEHRKMRQAGPFVMSGMEWERLHKTLEKPMAADEAVAHHFANIAHICDEFVDRVGAVRNLQDEVPGDFMAEVLKWALECMCSVTLNRKFGFLDPTGLSPTSDPGRLIEAVGAATDAIRRCEYGFHVWKFMETPAWKSLVKNCDTIDAILGKYVEHAQSYLKDTKFKTSNYTVIESLLARDDVLVEDVMTVLLDMFLIGANALAHSAAFLLYHLAKNPRCQRKLMQEIEKLPQQEPLTANAVRSMKYLRACARESLRLKPPIPILNRVLSEDAVIHKYFIPKGTYVLIATHLASLRDEYFEDALKFNPERWFSPEVSPIGDEIQRFASLPFGYGPRGCVAKELAEIEIGLLVIKTVKRFKVAYNYGDVESSNVLLASPAKPLKFTLEDRV
ncbi:probable cytochrome P450 49a1 [Cylas formicarius]|uniref:probable cytochrome P450 49a1 n=1 Tax=Cylas formicarius TaxID=197179 RepID=UPI00295899EB|nr:probable cytochrome P450 49a1 [Cylas formicarius]